MKKSSTTIIQNKILAHQVQYYTIYVHMHRHIPMHICKLYYNKLVLIPRNANKCQFQIKLSCCIEFKGEKKMS